MTRAPTHTPFLVLDPVIPNSRFLNPANPTTSGTKEWSKGRPGTPGKNTGSVGKGPGKGSPPTSVDRRVQRILDILTHDPLQRVSVEILAQSVNLSASRTRDLFRHQVGSPGRFIRRRQMQAAKRLLADSFLSVKEVMSRTGFADSDQTGFIRQFKKMFGLTPGEFQRRRKASQ
jgi:AraC-like DNA-binding protein